MARNKPFRIEVPAQETFRLGRVGVIAVVGFGIGVLWPRLAGLRLVPNLPADESDALSGAPDPEPAASAPPPTSVLPVKPPREPYLIGPAEVTSCRDSKKKKRTECDPIDFDLLARERIHTLSACEATQRADGVLSLGFNLDFDKDRVTGVELGKSTTLDEPVAQALLRCIEQNLGEVSLTGIRHEQSVYTVYYKIEIGGEKEPEAEEASEPVEATPASGVATVAWDVALVRAEPTREGEVVARLLQGVRVTVRARHGNWYQVEYDAKGSRGWVFSTAIGM